MRTRGDSRLIDLHLHTTASDGRLTPVDLVAHAAGRGVTTLSVTDHDTTAATRQVAEEARRHGMRAVSGIEVTAIHEDGRDIHVLGYFIDPGDAGFGAFLERQRGRRIARIEEIAARLATLGMAVDMREALSEAKRQTGRSIGRPVIARALIQAGYVSDIAEAFDRWLSPGRPGFIPREGPSVAETISMIHAAGGLASLAHPGKTRVDESIPRYRDEGLDAIETFHSDHTDDDCRRYSRLAAELGLLLTGGSDFHGDPAQGREPGSASLPSVEWDRLQAARSRG